MTFRKDHCGASFAVILGSLAFAIAGILGHSSLTLICSGVGILADLAVTAIWIFRTRSQR
jgi:hypothetical protein